MTSHATSSIFDNSGNLLAGAAAIIGALTVANRISAYRRYKRPSLLERLFRISYIPNPPVYRRNFRPRLEPIPIAPRRTIRKSPPVAPFRQPSRQPSRQAPHGMNGVGNGGHGSGGHGMSGHGGQARPGNGSGRDHRR